MSKIGTVPVNFIMPVFSDPSLLTAARLKEELEKHGVDFRPGKSKKYYVDLYSREVRDADSSRSKLDFSSDEEVRMTQKPVAVVKSQSRRSVGGSVKAVPQTTRASRTATQHDSVASLSDSELRSELEDYGFPVGPFTDISRNLYQSKLREYRQGNVATTAARASRRNVLLSDEEEEEEEDAGDEIGDEAVAGDIATDEDEVDYGPVVTSRSWSRISTLQRQSPPTVAQPGFTPPRPSATFGIRQRQPAASPPLARKTWSGNAHKPAPASTTTTGGPVAGKPTQFEAPGTDRHGNVFGQESGDQPDGLQYPSSRRQSRSSDFARFLELLAFGLLGFLLVVVLVYVEGPHQELLPARPFFPSNNQGSST